MSYTRVGWTPANGPKSGPPGPLVTGPVYGIGSPDGLGDGPIRRGLRNPLILALLAGAAFMLWKSDKKPRRNPPKRRARGYSVVLSDRNGIIAIHAFRKKATALRFAKSQRETGIRARVRPVYVK